MQLGPTAKLAVRQALQDEEQRMHTQSIVRSSNVLTAMRAVHAVFPSHAPMWGAMVRQAARLTGARTAQLYLRSGTLDGLSTRSVASRWTEAASVSAGELELAGTAWQVGTPQKRGAGSRCA